MAGVSAEATLTHRSSYWPTASSVSESLCGVCYLMPKLFADVTEPKYDPRDGLWHNRMRWVDEDGIQHGVTVEFSCPRPNVCPSTIDEGITRLQWALLHGTLEVAGELVGPRWKLPINLLHALMGFLEGASEEIPKRPTDKPASSDRPHPPAKDHAVPDGPEGDTIIVPIP